MLWTLQVIIDLQIKLYNNWKYLQNYNYHDLKKYNLLFPPCDYCVFGCCLHNSGVGPIWSTILDPPLPDRFDSPPIRFIPELDRRQ